VCLGLQVVVESHSAVDRLARPDKWDEMSWREPGIIIVCSYAREDGYYCTQSFDDAYRGLTDDWNAPIWPTAAPDRTDAPPDSLSGTDAPPDSLSGIVLPQRPIHARRRDHLLQRLGDLVAGLAPGSEEEAVRLLGGTR
jgi:hypothetical protein